MDKHAVAIVLDEISTLLEIHGDNKFKARAFANAARAIEKVEGNLTAMARSGEIEQVPGVGPATAAVIRELVNTGTSRYYLDLRERTPDGLLELLAVPHSEPRGSGSSSDNSASTRPKRSSALRANTASRR